MALGTPVVGTVAYGTTSVAPAYPAGITSGDVVLCAVGVKPTVDNEGGLSPIPTGWSGIASTFVTGTSYTGNPGIDTGNVYVYWYIKDLSQGANTGTVTFSTVGINVCWAVIIRVPAQAGIAAGTIPAVKSENLTGAATLSFVTSQYVAGTGIDVAVGDVLLYAYAIPTDVQTNQFSNYTITDPEGLATFSAPVELTELNSNLGNDIGGFVARSSVTAGSNTTTLPTIGVSVAGTLTNVRGPLSLIRIREADLSATLTQIFIAGSTANTFDGSSVSFDMEPITIINETFDGPLADMWLYSDPFGPGPEGSLILPGAFLVSGRLRFVSQAEDVNGFYSPGGEIESRTSTTLRKFYFPDGAYIRIRLYPPTATLIAQQEIAFFINVFDPLRFQLTGNGTTETLSINGVPFTYSRTNDAWWRFRRDGLFLHAETAPASGSNPGAWTIRNTVPLTSGKQWVHNYANSGGEVLLAYYDSPVVGNPYTNSIVEFEELTTGILPTTTDPRYARPSDDGPRIYWRPSVASTFFELLDETSPNDADYIYTELTGECTLELSSVTTPAPTTNLALKYRVRSPSGDRLIVRLKQGATVIATRTHTNLPAEWTTLTMVLTPAERAAITDYSNLQVELEAAQ